MDTKDIQQLIDFISQSGLDEVNIETADLKISVKRYGSGTPTTSAVPVAMPAVAAAAPASVVPPQQPAVAQAVPVAATTVPPKADTSSYITIKSPMIGTFYRSATPDSPLFVEVGDSISEGKVVCIIEAMKLFNEIESEIEGRIVKVLVENATPVEYDQPLFLVEPI